LKAKSDRSVERAATNETIFRDANERLRERRDELELDGATPFICECEEESCTTLIFATATEYESVRAEVRRFMLAPGHPFTLGEIISTNDRFVTVDKHGRAGEIAEERAPNR
jgi:hypothetical protein